MNWGSFFPYLIILIILFFVLAIYLLITAKDFKRIILGFEILLMSMVILLLSFSISDSTLTYDFLAYTLTFFILIIGFIFAIVGFVLNQQLKKVAKSTSLDFNFYPDLYEEELMTNDGPSMEQQKNQ